MDRVAGGTAASTIGSIGGAPASNTVRQLEQRTRGWTWLSSTQICECPHAGQTARNATGTHLHGAGRVQRCGLAAMKVTRSIPTSQPSSSDALIVVSSSLVGPAERRA